MEFLILPFNAVPLRSWIVIYWSWIVFTLLFERANESVGSISSKLMVTTGTSSGEEFS